MTVKILVFNKQVHEVKQRQQEVRSCDENTVCSSRQPCRRKMFRRNSFAFRNPQSHEETQKAAPTATPRHPLVQSCETSSPSSHSVVPDPLAMLCFVSSGSLIFESELQSVTVQTRHSRQQHWFHAMPHTHTVQKHSLGSVRLSPVTASFGTFAT